MSPESWFEIAKWGISATVAVGGALWKLWLAQRDDRRNIEALDRRVTEIEEADVAHRLALHEAVGHNPPAAPTGRRSNDLR